MDTCMCAWTYTKFLSHAGRPGLPLHSKAKMMLSVCVGGRPQAELLSLLKQILHVMYAEQLVINVVT